MPQGVAGYKCVLTETDSSEIIGKARDVDLTITATEIDTTTRDCGGWRFFIQGLKEWSSSIGQLWVSDHAGLDALRDAFFDGTEITAQFYDDNSRGFSGKAIVTGLTFGQPLDDAVTLDVTLKGTEELTGYSAGS